MNDIYVALYSYKYRPTEDTDEVSFESGDLFILKDSSHNEWWLVSPLLQSDAEFYVPANYITAKSEATFLSDVQNDHQSLDSAINGSRGSLSTDSGLSPSKNEQVDSGVETLDVETPTAEAPGFYAREEPSVVETEEETQVLSSPAAGSDADDKKPSFIINKSSNLFQNNWDQIVDRENKHEKPQQLSLQQNGLNKTISNSVFRHETQPKLLTSSSTSIGSNGSSHSSQTNRHSVLLSATVGRQQQENCYSSRRIPLTQVFSQRQSEIVTSSSNSYHQKTMSEVRATDSRGEGRSSFRKSLDDLISPESFSPEATPSMMSSTFSIATTTAAAPSADCLYWGPNEDPDADFADAFDNSSVNRFSHFDQLQRTYSFFESVDEVDEFEAEFRSSIPSNKDVLREGILCKKMEFENKSSLLSWAAYKQQGKYFVQLTERSLLFFKDKKHSQAYSSVAQSKPEHSFELFAANIEWKRGKKNTFQLWSDFLPGTKVLLKSPNPYDAAQWFDSINNAIVNLKTGITKMENDFDDQSLIDFPVRRNTTIVQQTSSDVTGSHSRLFFGQESNSSLASSSSNGAGGETFKVKNCLAQLLKSRPSQDALKKKGILKSAPVFGCLLEVRCQTEKKLIPDFLINAVAEVERRGLDIEGIYRLCGNMAEIQKLRFEVDKNSNYNLRQVNDIHVITGALKMYFRELPDSLFPCSSYEKLAQLISSGHQHEQAQCQRQQSDSSGGLCEKMKVIIESYPSSHQAVIRHLFNHLATVVENNVLNKMDSMNIAIVFGPNLIFPPDHISMAASVATTNAIMNYTLANLDTLFPPSDSSTSQSQSQSPLTFATLFHDTYRAAGDRDRDVSPNGFLTRPITGHENANDVTPVNSPVPPSQFNSSPLHSAPPPPSRSSIRNSNFIS